MELVKERPLSQLHNSSKNILTNQLLIAKILLASKTHEGFVRVTVDFPVPRHVAI